MAMARICSASHHTPATEKTSIPTWSHMFLPKLFIAGQLNPAHTQYTTAR